MKIPTGIASFFSTFWVKFGFILAIIVGLILLGGKLGYDLRDRTALQQQTQEQQQEAKDIADYKKQISDLLTKQHSLATQLDQALEQSQQIITKTVTKTIVKEIHDHPKEYQCPIPASGMSILSQQAQQLNSLRTH